MAISKKHLNDVCFLNGGYLKCRYLDQDYDENNNVISFCKKLTPEKNIIDEYVKNYLNDAANNNFDPKSKGLPLGDNCKGYIPLKKKLQGYDVD